MRRTLAICVAFALPITAALAQSGTNAGPDGLSMEQQTKVGDILTKEAGPPLHGGNFSLAVDSKVPAQVELRPVPGGVDAIAPQFRGRSYLVVDEQIAIIDPQSRTIVAVLQRWQSQSGGSAAPQSRCGHGTAPWNMPPQSGLAL
jgi:hypothetical protein